MKNSFLIILVFSLITACSDKDKSANMTMQLLTSSPQTDTIINILTHHDSILFPKKMEILEEFIEPQTLNSHYNSHYYGCIKFSHPDILQFIKINKLKVDDRTYGVFQPMDMPLKKEVMSSVRPIHELRKQSFDLFVDTVEDKLYLAKSYLDSSQRMY